MFKYLIVVVFILTATALQAQDRYFTKTGKIEFSSKGSMEDIEAKNKTVSAIIDVKTGAVQFALQMKSFEFEKKLMQEHFNENYVESDKYPKAEFKGVISNNSEINYTKDGSYSAKVKGKLTIHGVTKDVETTGIIKVEGGKPHVNSTINILLSDYNISIPSVVKDKLSNNVKIVIECKLEPLKS